MACARLSELSAAAAAAAAAAAEAAETVDEAVLEFVDEFESDVDGAAADCVVVVDVVVAVDVV